MFAGGAMTATVPRSLLKAISSSFGLICIVVSLVLLGSGATGTAPYFGAISDLWVKVLLLAIGTILLVPAVWLLFVELRLKHAPPPAVGTPRLAGVKDLGFAITEPKSGSEHGSSVQLRGTLKKAPPGKHKIWLIVRAGPDSWPQMDIPVRAGKKTLTWSVDYTPGIDKPKETQSLYFFLVGTDGDALIKLYKRINEHFHFVNPENPEWEAIGDLTSDMLPLGELQLTFVRDRARG
jgi:hypothetical protein